MVASIYSHGLLLVEFPELVLLIVESGSQVWGVGISLVLVGDWLKHINLLWLKLVITNLSILNNWDAWLAWGLWDWLLVIWLVGGDWHYVSLVVRGWVNVVVNGLVNIDSHIGVLDVLVVGILLSIGSWWS